jgi:hypothetical protein
MHANCKLFFVARHIVVRTVLIFLTEPPVICYSKQSREWCAGATIEIPTRASQTESDRPVLTSYYCQYLAGRSTVLSFFYQFERPALRSIINSREVKTDLYNSTLRTVIAPSPMSIQYCTDGQQALF